MVAVHLSLWAAALSARDTLLASLPDSSLTRATNGTTTSASSASASAHAIATAIATRGNVAQTAGYISGNPDSALTCPPSSTVSLDANFQNFGCCNGGLCKKPQLCQAGNVASCFGLDGLACPYTDILYCSDSILPSCGTYLLTATNAVRYASYGCIASGASLINVLATTTPAGGAVATSAVTSAGATYPYTIDTSISYTPFTYDTSAALASASSYLSAATKTTSGATDHTDTPTSTATTVTTPAATETTDSGGSGLTKDQKIALGCGIGFGSATIIIGLLAWLRPFKPK